MTARWIVLVLYLALMIGIGVYYRRKSASVNDFVLGGRGLGAWFTAFAYGTSYFSAVIFVGYAGKFGWTPERPSCWNPRCPASWRSARRRCRTSRRRAASSHPTAPGKYLVQCSRPAAEQGTGCPSAGGEARPAG